MNRLAWAATGTNLSPGRLVAGLGDIYKLLVGSPDRPGSGFFPPDFSRLGTYVEQMLYTVKLAVWGTALAVGLSLPLAYFGASNPSPYRWLYYLTRRPLDRLLDLLRGVDEYVMGLIFVAAVGRGAMPGVLAIALHTTGILGKLFSVLEVGGS